MWQPRQDDPSFLAFAISSSVVGTENPDALADYAEAMGLTMPVLADYEAEVYDAWFVDSPIYASPYPREFVVDRDGTILFIATDIDLEAIVAVIDQALADG